MSSILLKCSICPKKPSFSDVSHLLTHVGSKGHLSHLHKLQVRSHQEIAAGVELAAYDRWYQQHGLGQMLSDRMLQKAVKKGNKQGRPATRQPKAEPEPKRHRSRTPIDSRPPRQLHSNRANKKARRTTYDFDDDSEYDESPTRQRGRRRAPRVPSSPLKRSWSHGDRSSDADCPGDPDPATPKMDGSPLLKGVVWPGMDLFDAATEAMRKRRNQKKDGSALKRMEDISEAIMPSEAIYSFEGSWLKNRVITGNVDEDSPLRGETPIPKPVRRRRKPLAEVDANHLRSPARRTTKRRTRAQQLQDEGSSPYSLRSSTATSMRETPAFSPTEDENLEFKLTVGNLKDKTKRGNFTIFTDEDPQQRESMISDLDGRFIQPPKPVEFLTAPWLQPQYQQTTAYQTLYHSIDHMNSAAYLGYGTGKENVNPQAGLREYGKTVEPMSVSAEDHFRGIQPPRFGNRFGLGLNSFDDPFSYGSNPLSAPFQPLPHNLETFANNPYQMGENKGILSPNATVSDGDCMDGQAFATSDGHSEQ